MVVPFEELLDARSLQLCLVLKHLFRVSVLPLAICVFLIEVVFMLRWHKGCTYALFTQCIPIEVCKPLVLLHNVRTLFAQPVCWLSLDQTIDQVCSLRRPASWDVIWMNLDLLGQDLVSNLFTVFSMIRSLAKHAFVGNYAHCKVVHSNTMILSAHHFWCHVARRA